jgi:hypothetical protein
MQLRPYILGGRLGYVEDTWNIAGQMGRSLALTSSKSTPRHGVSDGVSVESDGAVFPGTIGAVGASEAQPVSSNAATSAAPSAPALCVAFAFAFIHRAFRPGAVVCNLTAGCYPITLHGGPASS